MVVMKTKRIKKEELVMKKSNSSEANPSCCEGSCGCHSKPSPQEPSKKSEDLSCGCEATAHELKIDFLYLDLTSCERCQHTESTLEKSIDHIKKLFETAGYQVVLNKIHIDSLEKAETFRFLSSPTIRVNGVDIIEQIDESNCEDCGEICGHDMNCRDWVFEGVRFTEPPEALIVRGILKEIYLPSQVKLDQDYKIPDNILKFFNKI